jgi:hypothetical protein
MRSPVSGRTILHRPPYLIARGPKDGSPVDCQKLNIYWVSMNVGPRISGDLHGHRRKPLTGDSRGWCRGRHLIAESAQLLN